MGRSVMSGSLLEGNNFSSSTAGTGAGHQGSLGGGIISSLSTPTTDHQPHETVHRNILPNSSPATFPFTLGGGAGEGGKGTVTDTVAAAIAEVVELLRTDEPLWSRTQGERGLVIHRERYDKVFPKGNYLKSSTARTESSKDSGVVAATPVQLIEMCLDPSKLMDFFPMMVPKAKIIEVLDSGMLGGSLQLMYEKMHILSPMVAPRDFVFLRYCGQVETHAWIMVDVSYDSFKDQLDTSAPSNSWRLPSGCLIQDLLNGTSKVTWVEHVQVDDKKQTHRLYRDLICGSQAYGAKRWIVTLQRMCERFGFFLALRSIPAANHELDEVINAPEGRRNMMHLSQRMVKGFCEVLSMSDRVDYMINNGGVRISLRGQPGGLVVCAATSLWLPLPTEQLFNFFMDEKLRGEWDALSGGHPVTEIAGISTGSYPGNRVSIILPLGRKESNMVMVQESSINSLEAYVVYATMKLPDITSAINGDDPVKFPIFPSGFVISGDGRLEKTSSSSGSSSKARAQCGSLLTVVIQSMMSNNSFSKEDNMECMAGVHALISTTIQKIKAALDCSELD
ncbi:unnamed protein product [Cuscuta epithymum]|uniref:START domain-containing protein n=1 Tax=Cuscuta epithymum TaxID=186058 RepID=A0AAV0FUR6_9ASTE|nr:unnamed protein product [Cuscuta epithymum]